MYYRMVLNGRTLHRYLCSRCMHAGPVVEAEAQGEALARARLSGWVIPEGTIDRADCAAPHLCPSCAAAPAASPTPRP